jgi:predicted ATP-dependent Lon-type protease
LIPGRAIESGGDHAYGRDGIERTPRLARLEAQITFGNGALNASGLGSNAPAKEAIKVGFNYFKANTSRLNSSISAGQDASRQRECMERLCGPHGSGSGDGAWKLLVETLAAA